MGKRLEQAGYEDAYAWGGAAVVRQLGELGEMSVTVRIPSPLYRLTGGLSVVKAQGGVISDVIEELEMRFPGLKDQLFDAQGALRPSMHIYVNGEDIRFLSGLQTRLEDEARVSIIPAIAGGHS